VSYSKEGEKMEDEYYYQSGGKLSNYNIEEAIQSGDIFIAPYNEKQLQPSGYNLTPTYFFYSTKKKKLLTIVRTEDETYVMVDKNDTVLVRTRESIAVSNRLSGAFYSKVKVVSQGFGHVSTTLDPNWEGQLLISLNNPTNKRLKFSIEKMVYGNKVYNSFVTLEFEYLNLPTVKKSDNVAGRLDILDATVEQNVSLLKKRKIDELYVLVGQLHIYEKKSIQNILLGVLDDSEKENWRQIQITQSKKEYEVQRNQFLARKQRKYLRLIQNEFEESAIQSINIVNKYIEEKQKVLPVRYRTFRYVIANLDKILNGTCSIILGVLITLEQLASSNEKFITTYGLITLFIINISDFLIRRLINKYN